MFKVLYLRSSFDPGGTESLLLNLFNYPQDRIQFYYVLLKDGRLIKQLKSSQNKYYTVFRTKPLDLKVVRRLLHLVDTEKTQVVHSHQLIELVYALLLKVLRPRLKIYHTIHGYHDHHWFLVLERFLILFTSKTFTVSKAAKVILERSGYSKKKIEVLPNAVNKIVLDKGRIAFFKQKFNIKVRETIIGMVGNFVPQKDQLTIIRTFNNIREKHPGLKLVFIGEKTKIAEECIKEVIPRDLNKRVFFEGSVEYAGGLIPLFDLFIMSTTTETFGIVVVESILAGVPVLASDIEPMKELSENGKYFSLFKIGNVQDLTEKLDHLLGNGELLKLKEKTQRSQAVFQKKYSLELYIHRLVINYA